MRALGFIAAACIVSAVLQYAIAILLIVLCVLMVWGTLFYCRRVVGFLIIAVASGMMENHPYITLGALALGALLKVE